MFAGLLGLADAPVELAEAKVAVSDERAPTERLGNLLGTVVIGASGFHGPIRGGSHLAYYPARIFVLGGESIGP